MRHKGLENYFLIRKLGLSIDTSQSLYSGNLTYQPNTSQSKRYEYIDMKTKMLIYLMNYRYITNYPYLLSRNLMPTQSLSSC
jgi:hypothetical protein